MTAPMLLLTSPDRHLCEHAGVVLDGHGLSWREVSSESAEGRE